MRRLLFRELSVVLFILGVSVAMAVTASSLAVKCECQAPTP